MKLDELLHSLDITGRFKVSHLSEPPTSLVVRSEPKIPTFQRDLDFVIRFPKELADRVDITNVLDDIEKEIRRSYRQLVLPQGEIVKYDVTGQGGHHADAPPAFYNVRSNAATYSPLLFLRDSARRHYSSPAILEAELQDLRAEAFTPDETTLVFPAGSLTKHMHYLLLDIYENANLGVSVGFEKFAALHRGDSQRCGSRPNSSSTDPPQNLEESSGP